MKDNRHQPPGIWWDLPERIAAVVAGLLFWWLVAGYLTKYCETAVRFKVLGWGALIVGAIAFFGTGERGFGN